jgi:hypothetical protein
MNDALSPNTQAILLLTAPLIVGRGAAGERPLSAGDYSRLATHLRDIGRKPADFLDATAEEVLRECQTVVDTDQVRRLLERGFLLSQAVERYIQLVFGTVLLMLWLELAAFSVWAAATRRLRGLSVLIFGVAAGAIWIIGVCQFQYVHDVSGALTAGVGRCP